MATDQKVQIEVELVGVKEAEKNLRAIESGGEQIGESFSKSGDMVKKEAANISKGVQGIGEGFSQAGGIVSTFGDQSSEALGAVGESISGLTGSFGELAESVNEGGLSFSNLALPIGGALLMIFELIKAFQEYQDEISGVNAHVEAYRASMAELTSAVEELAAKQVILTDTEVVNLQNMAKEAKLRIEKAQILSENTDKIERKIIRAKEEIKTLKAANKGTMARIKALKGSTSAIDIQTLAMIRSTNTIGINAKKINELSKSIIENQREQSRVLKENAKLTAEGQKLFAEFEAEKERLAERSLEHQKKIADQSLKLDIETAAIRIKQQKNSAQAERQIAALEHAAKLRELEKLEEVDEASRANRVQAAEIELNQKLKQIDRANYERIKTARAARAKAELAEQKNRINAQSALEMARINQNLKGEQNATNRKIALADLAFNRASQLLDLEADKNANSQTLKEALEINHQNRLTEIRDKAEADRIAKEQAAARELIASETALKEDILEIERLRAEVNLKGQDRELELLRLDYEQKFMMAKGNSEKILLLREQQSQQITAIQSRETEQLLDLTSDFFGSYGQGLADAAVGAIMFGESFSESIKAVLDGLAREAGVQALMELAKGTAALFTNPAGSGAHFKAAGLFGAAAILAKGAGSALAGGSSASAAGASGQASSPSGAPQTASAPRREQAEERTMVFNVNFSNSVIYDTKQAAQDAMVDQLVRNINTPRRGSRRVRFANA